MIVTLEFDTDAASVDHPTRLRTLALVETLLNTAGAALPDAPPLPGPLNEDPAPEEPPKPKRRRKAVPEAKAEPDPEPEAEAKPTLWPTSEPALAPEPPVKPKRRRKAKATEAPEAVEVPEEEVAASINRAVEAHGVRFVRETFEEFDAKKISDVDSERRPDLIAALDAGPA